MSDLPAWIQILQALLTPTIALGVGVIGYMQWRTAHQKVVLDLFDRRLKIYEDIVSIYDEFQRGNTPKSTPKQSNRALKAAELNARFLFDEDVCDAIRQMRLAILDLWPLLRAIDNAPDSEARSEIVESAKPIEDRLREWRFKFADLCLPYMRMKQRLVRTPGEWIKDKNRQRLSYADDHQR